MSANKEYVEGSNVNSTSKILDFLQECAHRLSGEGDNYCYPWQEESGGEWQNY